MRKWTTPMLAGTIETSVDLAACECYLTILQEGRDITKKIEPYLDGAVWRYEVPLTQKESGSLRAGVMSEYQINVVDASGWRGASNIVTRVPGRNVHWREL